MTQELKSNLTAPPKSAKTATNKSVIHGHAAQAAVDSTHQVIVAVDVVSSGSEQTMLMPMVEQAQRLGHDNTLITADAGYHSDTNATAHTFDMSGDRPAQPVGHPLDGGVAPLAWSWRDLMRGG